MTTLDFMRAPESRFPLSVFEARWSKVQFMPQKDGSNFNTVVLDYLNVEWFNWTQRELPYIPNGVANLIVDYVDHNERLHRLLMFELQYRVKVIYYRGRNRRHQAIICRNFYASSQNPRDGQPYPLLRRHICGHMIKHCHVPNKSRPKDNPCRYDDHQTCHRFAMWL